MEFVLQTLTQCSSPWGVVPFGGVEKFWPRMTDFGLKNCVFDLKTLSRHNSAPSWSWDFKLEHNVLHHMKKCLSWIGGGGCYAWLILGLKLLITYFERKTWLFRCAHFPLGVLQETVRPVLWYACAYKNKIILWKTLRGLYLIWNLLVFIMIWSCLKDLDVFFKFEGVYFPSNNYTYTYYSSSKTLSRHNSAPFWSWNFKLGHNVLHHEE